MTPVTLGIMAFNKMQLGVWKAIRSRSIWTYYTKEERLSHRGKSGKLSIKIIIKSQAIYGNNRGGQDIASASRRKFEGVFLPVDAVKNCGACSCRQAL